MVDESQMRAQIEQARRSLFERDYTSAERRLTRLWKATEHLPLPRAVSGPMRRLRAAALRLQGGSDRLREAVAILDRGLERTFRSPSDQACYWLDLGRTLAALGDADATRCFDMVAVGSAPKIDSTDIIDPVVLARAALEYARWRSTWHDSDDKHLVRMIASALDRTVLVFGETHAFVDGVRVFAHSIEVALPPQMLPDVYSRVMALAVREDLVHESRVVLEAGLACIEARDIEQAEELIRQSHVLERQCGGTKQRAPLHALAMVLYCEGRFEEAEACVDQKA